MNAAAQPPAQRDHTHTGESARVRRQLPPPASQKAGGQRREDQMSKAAEIVI
ncbi:MAG: hypothetical protein ACRDRL_19345 [Sciscionella sp.]